MNHRFTLFALLLVVAWLSAATTAVRSASRIWLRHWVERRLRGASAGSLIVERPQRLLVAGSAGAALALFVAGVLITDGADGVRLAIDLTIAAVIFLLFGQLFPRALARRWATTFVPVLVPTLRVLDMIVWPIVKSVRFLLRPVMPVVPAEPEDERAELEELLREGELEGVGEKEEIALISGVVQFGEKMVAEVMTPRDQVFAVDDALPPAQAASLIAQANYSRVPVYSGSLDQIRGMVHAFDVLKAGSALLNELRPVTKAPASQPCSELLFEMLRQRRHLAVVVDDTAHTVGIVTLEDLLEELVGEIRDEHDDPVMAAPLAPRKAS